MRQLARVVPEESKIQLLESTVAELVPLVAQLCSTMIQASLAIEALTKRILDNPKLPVDTMVLQQQNVQMAPTNPEIPAPTATVSMAEGQSSDQVDESTTKAVGVSMAGVRIKVKTNNTEDIPSKTGVTLKVPVPSESGSVVLMEPNQSLMLKVGVSMGNNLLKVEDGFVHVVLTNFTRKNVRIRKGMISVR